MIAPLLDAAIAGVIALCTTPIVRRYALRRELLDHPNERSSHAVPTPRGGGLAILAGCAVAFLILALAHPADWSLFATLTGGMAILGLVGWRDDHGGLSPRARLALQALVAAAAAWSLGGLPEVRLGTMTVHLGLFGGFLALVGIVWSVNLFNFMDGIDGIAGAQATLVGVGAALLTWSADATIAGAALAVGAASAGFLVWNWPPARIFMGDVGSGPLGFLLSAIAVAAERRGSLPILAFAILAAVFIADATVTLLRRIARRDRISQAHRDHAYQRLSRAWKSHRAVTIAASSLTGVFVGVAWVAVARPQFFVPAVGVVVLSTAGALLAVERIAPFGRS